MTELFPLLARYGAKTFNGQLKVPHLGELGMIEPQLANDMYIRLFQTLPSDDYVTFMNEFPTITLDHENAFYHWRVAGNNNKTVAIAISILCIAISVSLSLVSISIAITSSFDVYLCGFI